jgi:hypothetical protein
LKRYLKLVDEGEGQNPEVRQLRDQLEKELPGDIMLRRAELEMQRRDIMRRFAGGSE